MKVNSIRLSGFRNYDEAECRFHDSLNVICGDNAQGKTNLLESIFYLTSGNSFRTRSDRELINFGRDDARISADIVSGGRDQKLEIRLARGLRRKICVNGAKLKTAAELAGRLTAVLFCPDDLQIVRGGAAERRRFMDLCISQLRPKYAEALSAYSKLYVQKTRILKARREKPSLLASLQDYNELMAQKSAVIIHYRAAFVEKLAMHAKTIHSDFSNGRENLSLTYKTVGTISDPLLEPSKLLPLLMRHQEEHYRAELESGLCLSGAHKDDLKIEIDGAEARKFSSQGQARTAALSLKLSEREIFFRDTGEYPVLLLDDVLSELDGERRSFVLNRIGGGQVFITSCDEEELASRSGGVIRIRDGKIIAAEVF
jgi:DNA replication and repair protein RecF